MSSVIFHVNCGVTRPGECVFVTGSHPSLGSWTPANAVKLTTGAEEFPMWTSAAVSLSAGESLEYKFLVQKADCSGAARWEEFPGNHTVTLEQGKVLKASSVWNAKAVNVLVAAASEPAPKAPTQPGANSLRRDEEEVNLKMAEMSVEAAKVEAEVSSYTVKLNSRDKGRRNFSQSLLSLDQDEQSLTQGEGEVSVIQTPLDAEEAPLRAPPRLGASLQHIMSFSALTVMADAEQKEQHRKGTKAKSEYKPHNLDVPIVIVTAEVAPYSKTGGLGLVAASYAFEFPRNGHRTMVVSPKYKHFDGISYAGETRVIVNGREENVKYWHKFDDQGEGRGCDYIFVEHTSIQRDGGLYNGADGREYEDNLLRFTLLSMAAMEAPLILTIRGSKYGEKVIFLCNDWQSGLVPLLLNYKYRRHGCFTQARSIYVVHNLGYQGQYHSINAQHFFGIDHQAVSDVMHGNSVNLCKGALICADRVLTVSPKYAEEIQTPAGGFALQDFVRAKGHAMRLAGILNGIDDCWSPEADTDIFKSFSIDDFEAGKKANKVALQKSLGLNQDPDVILMGFVGRLSWQKGVDVLGECLSWMMQDAGNGVTGRCQVIMMGNGEKQYADTLRWAEGTFKGKVCGYVGFDPKVEHQMMAGCDLLLMPSRYEPCGLPQMCAQMYGCLPVVHATGGLADSVKDFSSNPPHVATGFHCSAPVPDKMKEACWKAMELYYKKPNDFKAMQRAAMQMDFYWPRAMDQYEKHIDFTLHDPQTTR